MFKVAAQCLHTRRNVHEHHQTIKYSPIKITLNAEEVGHIFCARDYALYLNGNNCVPNLNSLVPMSIWPGIKGKHKLLKGRSALKTVQVGKASSGVPGVSLNTGFSVVLHSCSFKRPYSLGDPGVDGIYSTGAFELCQVC